MGKGSRTSSSSGAIANIERGRENYRRRAWAEAYRLLSLADRSDPLGGDDLELVAISAALIGRTKEFLAAIERAYRMHLEAGNSTRAARAAFWHGFRLLSLGERGHAAGWFARAEKLVEGRDCVERGYLLLPTVHGHIAAGDANAACDAAASAAEIGERFEERDLVAFAHNLQGRALLLQGRVREGLALLDEAMVAASTKELSPIMTGILYCSAIDTCHRVYAFSRAREWTSALAEWCEGQPELVTFTGRCLVHRAELMQLNGAWLDAVAEARRASQREAVIADQQAAAAALYQEGEVYRLRGEFAAAENAYAGASRLGSEPQPGFALLRAVQGREDAAAAAIRRVLGATKETLQRTKFLPAYVDIMLRVGNIEEARSASKELADIAERFDSDVLGAMAAHAEGAVALAEGHAEAAIGPLRRSFEVWQQVGAPYISACLRVSIGLACRGLGDEDGAALEWNAARSVFEELGAAPDLARVDALAKGAAPSHGLTRRELQILRLVAAGKTNKAIASGLTLSEKTVDRHVSNIFVKLDVSSRAAATADAYKRKLI